MATTAAERQARFRARHRGAFRRFEVLLPNQTYWRIHEIAETTGLTVREAVERVVGCYREKPLPDNGPRENANTERTGPRAREQKPPQNPAGNYQDQAPAETGPPWGRGKGLDAVFEIVDDFKELGVSLSFGQALEIWRERQGPG